MLHNKIAPLDTMLIDKQQIQKYMKPKSIIKLKKHVRARLNPYSQSRLNKPLKTRERIVLKHINRILNIQCVKGHT